MLFLSAFKSSGKTFLTLLFTVISCAVIFAQNPIVTENLLAGNPSSEWDVSGLGDETIQGFATDISVNKGSTVHFKIDVETPATNYSIKIYRIGYYQGNGARLIANLGSFPGTSQPFIMSDPVTGLTDCNVWSESASWQVPSTAVSGVYIVRLQRADNNGSSHMVFIVRDDAGNSPVLFKTSDATWQAYNHYRYHSLYVGAVGAFSHAVKVSYNRPFYTRDGFGGGNGTKDWFFNAEYPMIRWMERNGYHVSYTTDLDMDRDPSPITPANHKIMLSVGHDEYWSLAERTKFENARNAGVHLAFFSGNECYWKTRWEDNRRTLVCYKEGTQGEYNCGGKCDPLPDVWTGIWRDGCTPSYGSNDGCRPENDLSGQLSWSNSRGAIQVPAIYKDMGFWRNTSIAGLASGEIATLPYGTLGDEWDAYQDAYASTYPQHRILLSSTFYHQQTHNLSLYRHSSGALVFAAGTINWAWGLDEMHDEPSSPASRDMQQATVNIFADMGVIPATLQSGFIASVSGDTQPPSTVITYPSNGSAFPGNVITIAGTATDAGGGAVAGVEVSVDGGIHWYAAIGTSNWMYSWQPEVAGAVNLKARAWDDLGNLEVVGAPGSGNNISVTISGAISYAVFQFVSPSVAAENYIGSGSDPLELGMKFRSNADGYVTGFRYYKGDGAQGVHIGNLWSSSGSNLASAVFTNETASGWQTVSLTSPIAVTANTIYVVSYFSPHGDYVKTSSYFSQDIVNGPITGLGWSLSEPNPVYRYSSVSAFPDNNAYVGSNNYWADVLFALAAPPDLTPPIVVSVLPVNNATSVPISYHPAATFNQALDPLSVNTNTFTLNGPGSNPVSGTLATSNGTATFTPDSPLSSNITYVATLKGGSVDPRIKNSSGIALAATYSWQFTSQSLSIPAVIVQPASQSAFNGSSVSFSSSATGSPTPAVQWQVSPDNGSSWQNITSATSSPYTFSVSLADNGKQFRARWTNSQGSVNSATATLTVISAISAKISAISASTCPGSSFQLQLSEANGQSPYSIVVNGITYYGVTVGVPFATINTTDESLWTNATIPDTPSQNDAGSIELGVKFRATTNGYVKGIRFYKGPGNTGTHTGSLWNVAGTSLAKATFSNETALGWQEVQFASPVAITANTTYIASYFTTTGHYAMNSGYFASSYSNGSHLQAPASNVVGGNGIYQYTINPLGAFPQTNSANFTNYWVDVIFSSSTSTNTFINNLTSITDNGGFTSTGNPLSSAVFTLNATATTVPAVISPVTWCQYSTSAPLSASGTSLLWYTAASGGTGSSTAPTPSTTVAGSTNYYVSQTITGCEGPRQLLSVIVNTIPAAPAANITQPGCLISSGTIQVTSQISGLFFSINGLDYTNTTGLFNGLSSGIYNLTAKNGSNCISDPSVITINIVPLSPAAPTATIVQPTCTTGTGKITVTSVITGLSFSINGSDYSNTTGIFSNVIPGIYSLTSRNYGNCISPPTSIFVLTQPLLPDPPVASIIQPTCNIPTGALTVTSTTTGLFFSVNGLDYTNTNGVFSGLTPGNYNLTAKNNSNCISSPTSVSISAAPLTPTATISVLASGICSGTPFQLKLASAAGQSPLSTYSLVINGMTYSGVAVGQTIATINTTEESIWAGSVVPGSQSSASGQSIELGVKFRSSADGYILGVRFYKGYGNSGTHTGSLWTTTGALLAKATFLNETFSGWQEVRFATPVAVMANTTYIASYFAPAGHNAQDALYFVTSYANGNFLLAPGATGNDGNGVYKLTGVPGGEFPNTNSSDRSNYWVDIIFSYSDSHTAFTNNLTSITESGGCTRTGNPISSVIASLSEPPAPAVAGPVTYCQGDVATQLSAVGTNLLWYTTLAGGTGISSAPTPSTLSEGSASYFVSQTISGCESTRAQIDIVVNPRLSASVSILADQNDVCAGTLVTFTASPVHGGTSPTYHWFKASTPVGTNSATYSFLPSNGDSISVVMASNASPCLSGSPATSNAVSMVVSQVVGTAGVIAGSAIIAQGTAGMPYAVDVIANATSYLWSYTGTGVTINGTGNSVTLDFSLTATNGQLKVMGHNACGDGIASFMVLNIQTVRILNLSAVMIEGLYNGGGAMRPVRDQTGPHFGAGVADYITVELHSAANYSIIVYSVSDVPLSISGSASVTIPAAYNGSYYITIRHRNSLQTVSAIAKSFSVSTISQSFGLPTDVYGGNLARMNDLSYAIYSGDVNQDGTIDTRDMIPVDNDSFNYVTGYVNSDVNGDGSADTRDMIYVDNNSAKYIGEVLP